MSTRAFPTAPEPALGDLYRGLSRRLEQIVRADAHASESVVEDACQYAWGSLLAQATRIRAEAALAWLATTAVREARRLMRVRERDLPLEADDTGMDESAEPMTPGGTDTLVEDRERLRLMRLLPERQQRILWLHALGLTYDEIAAYTGDTPRTVERQLLRGRHRIRQLAR